MFRYEEKLRGLKSELLEDHQFKVERIQEEKQSLEAKYEKLKKTVKENES